MVFVSKEVEAMKPMLDPARDLVGAIPYENWPAPY